MSWQLATTRHGDFFPLALTVFLSFVPAFFIPKLILSLSNRLHGREITSRLLCAFCGMAILIGLTRGETGWFVMTNFLALTLFMGLEVGWDMWFARLQRNSPALFTHRLSGATTASSQCALMIGPLFAHYLTSLFPGMAFYYLMAVAFAALGLACFAGSTIEARTDVLVQETVAPSQSVQVPMSLKLALGLVWPILGALNFMLPMYVSHGAGGDLKLLGELDASFGFGTALAGLCAILFADARRIWFVTIALSFFVFPAIWLWQLDGRGLLAKAMALMLLGISFGFARVQIRAMLARYVGEAEMGKIVASMNACAVPVLGVILTVQLYSPNWVWRAPFILILCEAALTLISLRHAHNGVDFDKGAAGDWRKVVSGKAEF
ncbi:MAG: hypothetical protein ACRYHA_31000 [Janthinobacterium lividum]